MDVIVFRTVGLKNILKSKFYYNDVMYIFGILSIFQILFLPGLLFQKVYKPTGSGAYRLSLIIGISMLTNAVIVYPLVLLHIYTRTLVLVLIVVEVAVLIWLSRMILASGIGNILSFVINKIRCVWKNFSELFKCEYSSVSLKFLHGSVVFVISVVAVGLLFWFLKLIPYNFGTVFNTWDAVVSWNAWAQGWAQNKIPSVHLTYPQLLSLNLSLTYLLIDNYQISLFAKSIMPVFVILTVFQTAELAVKTKKYGYLIGVIFIYLLYKKYLGEYLIDGYADIPVAFMTLTALIPYLEMDDLAVDHKRFGQSMLLATAAALTKQGGVLILFIVPIVSYINAYKKEDKLIKNMLLWTGIGLICILPWYLPILVRILQDSSVAGFDQYIALSAHEQSSASPLGRLFNSFLGLGKYFFLYLFMIPSLAFLPRKYRGLILIFIIPYAVFWGIVTSYSERNLSMTFALVAILFGLTLERIVNWFLMKMDRINPDRIPFGFILLLLSILIFWFSYNFPDSKLKNIWVTAQSKIFSPEINEALLTMDRSNPDCVKILTDYPVDYIPGLDGMQTHSTFNDYVYHEKMKQDPHICWILARFNVDPQIENDIAINLQKGIYQELKVSSDWIPYRLIKIK